LGIEVVPADQREIEVGEKQLNSYILKIEADEWEYEDDI
jgi:hypothetical protein